MRFGAKMPSDAVFQLQPVLLIVIAVQIVDDVLLRDVIGRADVKMRDQVLLHQFPCGAVRDADHLTKLTDGHDVRIIAQRFFIISRHFQSNKQSNTSLSHRVPLISDDLLIR